jgi:hypothetical protein
LVNARALTDDLRWENEILENLLVDIRQSPATRPLLFDARRACRFAEDTALGHENDMAVGELLLKLASKPRIVYVMDKEKGMIKTGASATPTVVSELVAVRAHKTMETLPRLNFVESLQLRNGHEQNDRLFTPAHVHLACGGNLKGTQLRLEVGHTVLEINQCLCDSDLCLVGWGCWRIRRTEDFMLHGHNEALFFLVG